jgi:hypothetical protein
LQQLLALLQTRNVRRYLEIGARDGDTLHDVGMVLPEGSTLVAVDLPDGKWGRRDSLRNLRKACIDLRNQGRQPRMVLGSSQSPEVLGMVDRYGPYDAILIDGDHSYAAVKSDWLMYGSLTPLTVFHDIAGEGESDKSRGIPVEVPRLWAEIKATGVETREFIAPDSRMGIGVVIKPMER